MIASAVGAAMDADVEEGVGFPRIRSEEEEARP